MTDDLEPFLRIRGHKICREPVELRLAGRKGMVPRRIARPQPLQTNRIRHVQKMQPSGDTRIHRHLPHPTPLRPCVGGKIQHDRHARTQQRHHVRCHNTL